MTLSQLYYFRKLAQLEHYTKAAQELYISQPSLSASISSLEDELKVKLFQKSGRNIHLTDTGRQFYEIVCQCLNVLEAGIEDLQSQGEEETVIDLVCEAPLLLDFIPKLLTSFQSYGDSIKFHLHCDDLSGIITGVRSGKYSFGFSITQRYDPDLVFLDFTSANAFPQETQLLSKSRSLLSVLSVTDERVEPKQLFFVYSKMRYLPEAEQKFLTFIKQNQSS
ncbi:LysR family transcriptional regulator [bacterium 210820-DFI.6.37]|nr:LysR family transcriptional regulator [bacterium 210820-DFI.6.37]